jgi:WD40 repeat protein/uncharacterized caspase-like protein
MPPDDKPVYVPAPNLPAGTRDALIVATNSYADPLLRELRSPVKDAEGLATVLADPAIGGFEVKMLVDRKEGVLRREIARFLGNRQASETILIYLSCHGLQDPRGRLYFAATDTDSGSPQASAVRSADLIEMMDECKASRQILILDCCFSGSFGDKAAGGPGASGGPNLEQQLLGGHSRGREVLTASRAFEYSFEGEPLGGAITGSVFTTGLVEGMLLGTADHDKDGYVTVDEAYDYAFRYVQRDGTPQTPQRFLYSGEGDRIILARSAAGRAVWPAELPSNWVSALEDPSPQLRAGAVNALAEWLSDTDPARVIAAKRKLRQIADEEIPRVAAIARKHVELARQAEEAAPSPPQPAKNPALVELWSSAPPVILRHGRDEANCAAFSPDGRLLASGGWGRVIRLWDVATGDEVSSLTVSGKATAVLDVAFSPDGTLLASADTDGGLRLWDVRRGRQLRMRPCKEKIGSVEFGSDGTVLVTGHLGGSVCVWNVSSLKRLRELKVNGDPIFDVAVNPKGSFLASAGADGRVRVRFTAVGETIFQHKSHVGWATGVAFSPDGTLLASSGAAGEVIMHEALTGNRVRELKAGSDKINGIAFSQDGAQLAVGYQHGTVGVWELGTDHQYVLVGHQGAVHSVACSPAETLIASAGKDGTVRLWR